MMVQDLSTTSGWLPSWMNVNALIGVQSVKPASCNHHYLFSIITKLVRCTQLGYGNIITFHVSFRLVLVLRIIES